MVTKSKIPPSVLGKLERLRTSERKEYLQDLISNYHQKTQNLDYYARRQIEHWALHQKLHFDVVIAELQAILDAS